MLEALKRVAAALKLLKQAKRRGVDVKPARPLVKQCARALKSKDYASAIRLAEEVQSVSPRKSRGTPGANRPPTFRELALLILKLMQTARSRG